MAEKELTEQYLASLSSKVGHDWILLGISLGFRHVQLEQLQDAHQHNVSQAIRKMLLEWMNGVAQFNTLDPIELLYHALKDSGHVELSEELRNEFIGVAGLDSVDGFLDADVKNRKGLEEVLSNVVFHRECSDDLHRLLGQTKHILDTWKRKRGLYIVTNAWKKAKELFNKRNCLLITGNPGDGKTTLAKYLLCQAEAEGFETVIVTDPKLIESCCNVEKKLIFFVDDAFGTPTVNNQMVETWTRMHEKLSALIGAGCFGLIIASRKQVLLSCQLLLEGCETYLSDQIDLTAPEVQLTASEKEEMLKVYCKTNHVDITSRMLMKSREYSLSGYPLVCSLFSSDTRLQASEDFFSKPLSVLQQQISVLGQTDPLAYCGLVLLLMHDGKLPRDAFDVFSLSEEEKGKVATIKEACGLDHSVPLPNIEDHLQSLIGVYVEESDEHYAFIHDAIFDTLTLVFGVKYPRQILKLCSADFLKKRVRTESVVKSTSSTHPHDILVVKQVHYKDLALRFFDDIIKGYISNTFENVCIRQREIESFLVKEFEKLPQQRIDSLKYLRDKESGKGLLYHTCRGGTNCLVKCLLKRGMKITSDLLIVAIERKHSEIVETLISFGADVNEQLASSGKGPIHFAAFRGDQHIMSMLLASGADPLSGSSSGAQAIHFACQGGHVPIVRKLLELGADPEAQDAFGRQPCHYAADGGFAKCVEILLQKGAKASARDSLGFEASHYAAEFQDGELLNLLIQHGVDINSANDEGKTPLHYACRWSRVQNIKLLLKHGANVDACDNRGKQPIHLACEAEVECVRLLLEENNVDINVQDKEGLQPLHEACKRTSDRGLKTAELLIEKGAGINGADKDGMQPLHYACDSNSEMCARLLIQKGADINAKGFMLRQPIHFTCASGNLGLTKLLLDKGADKDADSRDRKKPIHYACQYNMVDCLNLLLDAGVDVDSPDSHQAVPLHYGCIFSHFQIVTILMKRGANPVLKDFMDRTPEDMLPLWSTCDQDIRKLLHGQRQSE